MKWLRLRPGETMNKWGEAYGVGGEVRLVKLGEARYGVSRRGGAAGV